MADGSLSQFKATLSRKIERNQKKQARSERNSSSYKGSNSKPEYNFKKLSDSELEEVKSNIQKKAQLERKKEVITLTITVSILILTIYLLFK